MDASGSLPMLVCCNRILHIRRRSIVPVLDADEVAPDMPNKNDMTHSKGNIYTYAV